MGVPSQPELTGGPFGRWDRPSRNVPLPDERHWSRIQDLLAKVAAADYPDHREYLLEKIRMHIDLISVQAMANIDEDYKVLCR